MSAEYYSRLGLSIYLIRVDKFDGILRDSVLIVNMNLCVKLSAQVVCYDYTHVIMSIVIGYAVDNLACTCFFYYVVVISCFFKLESVKFNTSVRCVIYALKEFDFLPRSVRSVKLEAEISAAENLARKCLVTGKLGGCGICRVCVYKAYLL